MLKGPKEEVWLFLCECSINWLRHSESAKHTITFCLVESFATPFKQQSSEQLLEHLRSEYHKKTERAPAPAESLVANKKVISFLTPENTRHVNYRSNLRHSGALLSKVRTKISNGTLSISSGSVYILALFPKHRILSISAQRHPSRCSVAEWFKSLAADQRDIAVAISMWSFDSVAESLDRFVSAQQPRFIGIPEVHSFEFCDPWRFCGHFRGFADDYRLVSR